MSDSVGLLIDQCLVRPLLEEWGADEAGEKIVGGLRSRTDIGNRRRVKRPVLTL